MQKMLTLERRPSDGFRGGRRRIRPHRRSITPSDNPTTVFTEQFHSRRSVPMPLAPSPQSERQVFPPLDSSEVVGIGPTGSAVGMHLVPKVHFGGSYRASTTIESPVDSVDALLVHLRDSGHDSLADDILRFLTDDPISSDLSDALRDLYDVQEAAQEEGNVAPDDDTVKRAEDILRALYRVSPRPFSIYAMPEGDVAIDADSPEGTKLVVMCDPDGTARCLVYINDALERREYGDPSVIPDSFIVEALKQTQGGLPTHSP